MGILNFDYSLDKKEIFEKINETISTITKDLFGTLGYDVVGNYSFNKAYFSSKDKISYDFLQQLSSQADQKIGELHDLEKAIQGISVLNAVQKNLFLEKVNKEILSLQYHQHVMYLEAEKAGFSITDEERNFHNQEKLKIESILYGPSILYRPERLKKIGEKLQEISDIKKQALSSEDIMFWNDKILSHFDGYSNKDLTKGKESNSVFIGEETLLPLVELMFQLQGFKKEDLLKIKLSQDENLNQVQKEGDVFVVPQTWNDSDIYSFFEQSGLGDKFKIIQQARGTNSVGISDTKRHIKLGSPKNGKYDLKNSVLPIIFDHEIATHVQTGVGNLNNANVRDSSRLDLEEGIAILNQKIGQGDSLNTIYEAIIGDICQFFGETLNDDDLKRALKIYFFMTNNTGDIDDRFRRIRKGIPLGEKGSRRQDLTYGNSKEILRDMEKLSKSPEGVQILNQYAKAIYSTKLGYDSLSNIEEILDGIKKIEDLEPNFPVFAGKILYWKLFKGKLNKDEMLKGDIRSIIETNQDISYSEKKLLVQLKQLIEQDKQYQITKR